VPGCLRRCDEESVFRPHGAERYASQAQLTLEEELLARAQAPGAPRLDPEVAARLLGAGRERLEAQLRPGATTAAAMTEATGSGLRMGQAAAVWFLLTSPRRAEVMIGPPGTSKTRTAVEFARAWTAAGMGPAVALTTSSSARIRRRSGEGDGPGRGRPGTRGRLGRQLPAASYDRVMTQPDDVALPSPSSALLQLARLKAGLSQRELAERAGSRSR
jgi:hypothetical protein